MYIYISNQLLGDNIMKIFYGAVRKYLFLVILALLCLLTVSAGALDLNEAPEEVINFSWNLDLIFVTNIKFVIQKSKRGAIYLKNNIPINTRCHFEKRSDEKSVYTLVDAYRSFTTFRMTQ